MKTYAEKLAEARALHGKPFHIEGRQGRIRPKSEFVLRLERMQKEAAAEAAEAAAENVVPIQRKGRTQC